jgi:hypothetical protein
MGGEEGSLATGVLFAKTVGSADKVAEEPAGILEPAPSLLAAHHHAA